MFNNAELFRRRIRESLKRNREAFESEQLNRDALDQLLGLSEVQIRSILPAGAHLDVYANLVSVVKEATRANVDQAELRRAIEQLGELAVSIAKKVPQLAVLLS